MRAKSEWDHNENKCVRRFAAGYLFGADSAPVDPDNPTPVDPDNEK